MTAHDLISDIFSRVQSGVPGNERCITRAQLDFLVRLIGEDEEGGAMRSDGPGVSVWTPSGRNKYIITEDLSGRRHRLTRLSALAPVAAGRLF
jgi:hypothetical protein